jgi:hypothetical protein
MATREEIVAAKSVLRSPPPDVLRAKLQWTVRYTPIVPGRGIKPGIHGRYETKDEAYAGAIECHKWFNEKEEVVKVEAFEPEEQVEVDEYGMALAEAAA